MKIQIAGSGCPRCIQTEKNVIEACSKLNIAADISHIYDVKEFPKLGVRVTPAVLIDGKVVISGKVPTVDELKKIISNYNK